MSGTPPPPPGAWGARGLALEAAAWLVLARVLIARVPFARWRDRLGPRAAPPKAVASDAAVHLPGNLSARRLARAVERGAARLPGPTRCLARAMALHWMLRRRRVTSRLHIGVRPGAERGGLDDLHAWVSRDGEVLIGAGPGPYAVLYLADNGAGAG